MFPQGVELANLQFILDFMYNGEATVAQEELNSFLAVAEELKVKGLTQNQSKGKQESSSTAPSQSLLLPPACQTNNHQQEDLHPPLCSSPNGTQSLLLIMNTHKSSS